MTLKECYAQMGADVSEVLGRMGKEERVKKYLAMFPGEPSFDTLCQAMAAGDGQEAFRAAHSLKGICMNLGLAPLLNSVSALTEDLRGGELNDAALAGFGTVAEDYRRVCDCIQGFLQA